MTHPFIRAFVRAALVNGVVVLPILAQAPRAAPPTSDTLGAASAPICRVAQIALRTDTEGDSFAGMSHNGTYLVLQNTSTAACRVPAIPSFSLSDASGRIQATATVPGTRFLHPGPAVRPLIVAPGAALRSRLYWIHGPVFDQNICRTPTQLSMVVGGETKTIPFGGDQMCGNGAAGGIAYEVSRFTPDSTRTNGAPAHVGRHRPGRGDGVRRVHCPPPRSPSNPVLNDGTSLSPGTVEALRAAGAVGDVTLRFSDHDGVLVQPSLADRQSAANTAIGRISRRVRNRCTPGGYRR